MARIIKNINHSYFNDGDISYLTIERWLPEIEKTLPHYDAVLITTKNTDEFYKIVSTIRTHNTQDIFLKPVFYKHKIESNSSIHTDGLFEEEFSSQTVKEIQKNIAKTILPSELDFNSLIKIKTVQYLFTRKAILIPKKSRAEKIGYLFPFISLYFPKEQSEMVKILRKMNKEGLFDSDLKDKIQLCNSCHDSFMIYKESCPKCSSIDITANDVIHHFPCAHVAPASSFTVADSDELQCPKCSKTLRHIGIDYDKPSSVFTCNSCENHFQESKVVAECHSCNHANPLEELIEVPIYNYKLTMKGFLLAESKYYEKQEQKNQDSEIFEQLLQQEKIRNFTSGKSSYHIILNFESKLFQILDENYLKKFWSEILQITSQYITVKIYQVKTENTIQLMLINKTEAEAKHLYQKLNQNLNILLEDNIGDNIKLNMKLTDIKTL